MGKKIDSRRHTTIGGKAKYRRSAACFFACDLEISKSFASVTARDASRPGLGSHQLGSDSLISLSQEGLHSAYLGDSGS